MNRKQFILSHGATCRNWTWSWSFVNEAERIVIFGEWDHHIEGNRTKIMGTDWEFSRKGNRNAAYKQCLEHLQLVEESGYQLRTFRMTRDENQRDQFGDEPSKIKSFVPKLEVKKLVKIDNQWFAMDPD